LLSDVWSFGILVFEIIAQQEPHSDADPIEVGRLIRDNALTPVIPESCPLNLVTIMKQCWNIDPNKRPAIDQILNDLDKI
jgi:serine/threonine protein kinase